MKILKSNTISGKLARIIGILTFAYSSIVIIYFYYRFSSNLINFATEKSEILSNQYANEISTTINNSFIISRILAQTLLATKNIENPIQISREDASLMIRNLVDKNTFLLGMYTAWETNAYDNKDKSYISLPYNHPNGHFVPYWFRDSKNKLHFEPLKYYQVEGKGDYYLKARKTKKETIIDPISYKLDDKDILLLTVVVPIIDSKGKFLGITGADISTEYIQMIINRSNIFEGNAELFFVSSNGTLVANSISEKKNGTLIGESFPILSKSLQKTTLNKNSAKIINDTLQTVIPIYFNATALPWNLIIKTPLSYHTANLRNELIELALYSLLFLAILILATSFAVVRFLKPIKKITRIAEKLSVGNLEVWEIVETSEEIHHLNMAFNKVIQSQKEITSICSAVAAGDFSQKAIVKSNNDILAKSVNEMTKFLEINREEEEIRKWINEGYTKFAENLKTEDDIEKLTRKTLSFLINYLNANQGGVFILKNNDSQDLYLELITTYAYQKNKYLQKRIEISEGMVGEVFKNREKIIMTKLPSNYLEITSGLGYALPNFLIILPMIYNDKCEGVVEIASFNALKDYQIDFLEKCISNLASFVSAIKINEYTRRILEELQRKNEY